MVIAAAAAVLVTLALTLVLVLTLVVVVDVDYACLFTFLLYEFHVVLFILRGIASSSNQGRLEAGMGGEEPSILLSFCL